MAATGPLPASERLIAGAMSGTSADGVDVAVVAIAGRGHAMSARLLCHRHRPYDPSLRQLIFALRGGEPVTLADVARCTREISEAYAAAVGDALSAAGVAASDMAAVAAHGQTLYHAPPETIQLLDPALLAARVGCPVVSDFRRADCAAGGQGAPLVPFADYILFRDPEKTRVLLNIGGIANVTFLRAGAGIDEVVAYDTGPGNCVSDWLCRTVDPAGPGYDAGGERAMRGEVRDDIIHRIDTSFFRRLPPKSTDVPEMISHFRDAIGGDPRRFALEDLLATACWLSVEEALNQTFTFVDAEFDQVIVAGGGTRNARMMEELKRWAAETSGVEVLTSDSVGVPSDAREAVAFALLAAATLDGLPSNVPPATGARRPVVLGSITPGP